MIELLLFPSQAIPLWYVVSSYIQVNAHLEKFNKSTVHETAFASQQPSQTQRLF
jgi:hypothetical protein